MLGAIGGGAEMTTATAIGIDGTSRQGACQRV